MSGAQETKELVCVGCPVGCPLQLTHEGTKLVEVHGHECNRGAKYAKQEFKDPRRGLATTVIIEGARWARLPVKVSNPVPKGRVLEAARLIHAIVAKAPVSVGDVLLTGLFGEENLEVVATRSMERV
ncbi:MAG: DUF1667 domain-containing protein [Deltaproteobacteria bacterium]|nr:DUF1667 domain-containing protein [Deltaproteobacteria bacterium]